MRILLSLPLLLALFGSSLAGKDKVVTSTNCINGRCVECVNGVCREVIDRRREASEQSTSSSKDCVSHNGHESCRICVNGLCHTTTNGKREVSEEEQNRNISFWANRTRIGDVGKRETHNTTIQSPILHNCTHFANGTQFQPICDSEGCWRHNTTFSHRTICTFETYEEMRHHHKREVSEENNEYRRYWKKREASAQSNSNSKDCVSHNGHETCKICVNGLCHTTTNGKREVSEEDQNRNRSNITFGYVGKREIVIDTRDRRGHNCTHYKNGTRFQPNCDSRGCWQYNTTWKYSYMTNCTFITHEEMRHHKREASEEEQNNNSASSVNNIKIGGKREASEQSNSNSKDCVSHNGHETCRICVNGLCHTTTNGKREASEAEEYNNSASSENNIQLE